MAAAGGSRYHRGNARQVNTPDSHDDHVEIRSRRGGRSAAGRRGHSDAEGSEPHGNDERRASSNNEDGDEDEQDEDENDDNEDEDDEEEDDDDDEEEEEDEAEVDGEMDEEEDDESPFKFLERIDPKLFGPGFDFATLTRRHHPRASLTPSSTPTVATRAAGSHDGRSPAPTMDDAEFYGAMIQMLTHVLGSSDSVSWTNQPTPGSQLAASPMSHAYSSPAHTPFGAGAALSASSRSARGSGKSEYSALQPLIQALIARLGKDQQLSRRPVGEQDLTALLQTLMEQQQRQQEQQNRQQGASNHIGRVYQTNGFAVPQQTPLAASTSNGDASGVHGQNTSNGVHSGTPAAAQTTYQALNFADLDFEDEDEDDPDFNPDLNPNLPLPSAWSMAVRDVVASEESRAAAAAAAVAASHSDNNSGHQTPAFEGDSVSLSASAPPEIQHTEAQSTVPRKRGRKPILAPGEAQRRRAQRNIEYQRQRREAKKAEESEQSEAVLELRAEVKMLRAEMERLRDENATLRAQRELERLQRTSHR